VQTCDEIIRDMLPQETVLPQVRKLPLTTRGPLRWYQTGNMSMRATGGSSSS
jgi:hypothetical protein